MPHPLCVPCCALWLFPPQCATSAANFCIPACAGVNRLRLHMYVHVALTSCTRKQKVVTCSARRQQLPCRLVMSAGGWLGEERGGRCRWRCCRRRGVLRRAPETLHITWGQLSAISSGARVVLHFKAPGRQAKPPGHGKHRWPTNSVSKLHPLLRNSIRPGRRLPAHPQ